MTIPHALRLAGHFESWAAREWSFVDATAMLTQVGPVADSLAMLIERKRGFQESVHFLEAVESLVSPTRDYNAKHPIQWTDGADGARQTESRGVAVRMKRGGWQVCDSASESARRLIEAAQPAIQAAFRTAEYIGGWAEEFATQQDYDDEFELMLSHIAPEFAAEIRRDYYGQSYETAEAYGSGSGRRDAPELGAVPDSIGDQKRPLTETQLKLWDALKGQALTAKELNGKMTSSKEPVRQLVLECRRRGYRIDRLSGRGYYRPDAPPPDFPT